RCASSLNKNTFVLCKTVPTVPSIIKKSHSELKEDNKESLQRIKSLIIPDRTNDPVFDVANRSNFYDIHVHSNIYDDNKYAEAVLKSIMSSTQKLNNRVKSIENYDNKKSYIYSDEGNIQHLKVLQKLIVDRYVGSTRGNILSEKNEGMNRISYSENYIELIKKIHTNKKIDCRLGIFLYTSFQKLKTWKVKHDLDNTYYRIFCFDTDGSLVKPESFKKDDQNNLTLEFSKPVSGKVLLMYDEYDQILVEKKNIKEYFGLIHNKKLNVLIGVRYDDGYIFRINGLERDFFVYDLFDGNNQLTEKVSKIDVSADGFYLEFEGKQTFSSKIECYLLPSYEFYGGSNTFRIFPRDIKDITSNFNIFQDQLTIWG
ncbi:hypothetical protein, partial [Proteus mirabilis]|uniref:hypothetical protein n=1 Tax=Proteus mirabilis TaxID=584 RepID=UPI0034D618D9